MTGANYGGSVGRHSQSMMQLGGGDTQSNAYATINKLPLAPGAGASGAGRRSLFGTAAGDGGASGAPPDYATLEKYVSSSAARSPPGPVVPGIHATPGHFSAHSLPRGGLGRRFSGGGGGDFGGSNLVINRQGEAELVADLM